MSHTVRCWATQYVSKLVNQEGNTIINNQILHARKKTVDESFVLGFDLQDLYKQLTALCSTMSQVIHAFSTTRCQERDHTTADGTRCLAAILQLLGQRSQQNSWSKHLFGLYLYATGTQRQTISVLSTWGVCSSYSTVAGSQAKSTSSHDNKSKKGKEKAYQSSETECPSQMATATSTTATTLPSTHQNVYAGLIRRLSQACCITVQQAARIHQLSHVYDNINLLFKAAEQVIGRKDSLEYSTCATAIRIFEAAKNDMKTANLLETMQKAPELSVRDVVLTQQENTLYPAVLTHTILQIVVTHDGPSFSRFHNDIAKSLPVTENQIPLHKTEFYPLPAMDIDKSSTVGNADVIDAISNALAYNTTSPEYLHTVKIYLGDQLSMTRLGSVGQNRVGHDALCHTHMNVVQAMRLFHGQMHVASGCLDTHWGLPSAGSQDPGSLSFHNTVLDCKPILLSSPPPYQTCS
ncbi:hypothetical protein BC835DRAFT_1286604 [Cytidiella melzeri]|nr:hypothetical protein BC835DRAFT_1286604 [Cytidiella melzeri]